MSRGKFVTFEKRQMVNHLHERGFNGAFIGRQLNLSKSVVSRIINAWKRGDIVTKRKIQRKPKLTAQEVYKVLKYFLDHPFDTYKQCVVRLRLAVTENTIRSVLKGDGIHNRVACEKPFLTLLNQVKRLRFAIKYQHWTECHRMAASEFS